jgi:chromosome segregation ATPase
MMTQSDAIEKIYKSMSSVIEALTKENNNISEEIKKIHAELSYIKIDSESAANAANIELGHLHQTIEAIKEAICQNNLLKQILDTRTQLLQAIQTNTLALRKEIADVKQLKDDIYSSARDTFTQHTAELNARIDQLLKEQRLATAQYARTDYMRKITELNDRITALELRRTDVPPITPLAPL